MCVCSFRVCILGLMFFSDGLSKAFLGLFVLFRMLVFFMFWRRGAEGLMGKVRRDYRAKEKRMAYLPPQRNGSNAWLGTPMNTQTPLLY